MTIERAGHAAVVLVQFRLAPVSVVASSAPLAIMGNVAKALALLSVILLSISMLLIE
jgi:hypothetical protein